MSLEFTFESGKPRRHPGGHRPAEGDPFRILVIGDFSGRASRGVVSGLAGRKPHAVDIDTLDELPKRLGTCVSCAGIDVDVLSLDDLHPDELFEKHDVFAALRRLRARLLNPGTFQEAAAEVRGWAGDADEPADEPAAGPHATQQDEPAQESDFAALLGGKLSADRDPPASRAANAAEDLVRRIIAPYIVPDADPRQDELVAVVDRAIADQMRAILHDHSWQGVESAWRGLQLLATSLELGETVTLAVLDASRAEISADLASGGSGLRSLLVDTPVQTPGGSAWSVLALLDRFGPSAEDAGDLQALAPIASASGAVLLAGADDAMVGVESIAASPDPAGWADATAAGDAANAWKTLREMDDADSIGLVAPRFLLRLPYGPKTDPVDGFPFDEAEAMTHQDYLWGNGAFVAALLLGRAAETMGWQARPAGSGEVDDLPVHVLPDGEMKPCAEAWLTDRAADAMLAMNLMPLLSIQRRGAVRLAAMKAITGRALAASWG